MPATGAARFPGLPRTDVEVPRLLPVPEPLPEAISPEALRRMGWGGSIQPFFSEAMEQPRGASGFGAPQASWRRL